MEIEVETHSSPDKHAEIFVAKCRICSGDNVLPILSLGRMPLANAFLTSPRPEVEEIKYLLDLVLCPSCGLIQITETVPKEKLFRTYPYFSSFSDTMLAHVESLVGQQVESLGLDSNSQVIEIASNDGYLLQFYRKRGIPVLGIEPAINVAQVATMERNIPTICEFFCERLGRRLAEEGKQADVIHLHNVLAHVHDLHDFLAGLSVLLKEEGTAIIEVPYVSDLFDGSQFDTIYHEHLSYFSLTALERLFSDHDLFIHNVGRFPIHGGSLRVTIGKNRPKSDNHGVSALLEKESQWGIKDPHVYARLDLKIEETRNSLRKLLKKLKAENKRIAAYGASAKGTMLLNILDIGTDFLDFVVDCTPYKQGLFVPGVHVPIFGPEMLHEINPDYVLMLAWNFSKEILQKEEGFRRLGGKFIVPIPTVTVV